MKNKKLVVVGLACAMGIFASTSSANAQIGGSVASGSSDASGSNTGNYGKTDYLNTGKQAFQPYNQQVQNYYSPNTSMPSANDHAAKQTPNVRTMVDSDGSGLNMVSTAPMAPGTVNNIPIPSGQFNYGFNTSGPGAFAQPYYGSYASGNRTGSMLPQVSTGSVDFNTVDNSGFVPYGGSPIIPMGSATQMLNSIPSAASSASSVYNWLQNSFFGP